MTSSTPASPIIRSSSQSPTMASPRSLSQTYYTASSARTKLMKEAGRSDHNLRRLVGHANLLDNLMLDLTHAEEEQESRYNTTVKTASKPAEPKHIQWADAIPEEVEMEEALEDSSDSDSESDDEDVYEMEDDEYDEDLALTRTVSHQVPELTHDDDSDDSESDDDSMPPSPKQNDIPLDAFSEKQRQAIATTSFFPQTSSIPSSAESMFDIPMQTAVAVC